MEILHHSVVDSLSRETFYHIIIVKEKKKGKAIPITGRGDP
jgi:hypothetical protein